MPRPRLRWPVYAALDEGQARQKAKRLEVWKAGQRRQAVIVDRNDNCGDDCAGVSRIAHVPIIEDVAHQAAYR